MVNDIYPVKDCYHICVLTVLASLGAVRLVCSIVTKTRTARSMVTNGNTSAFATWRTFILFYHKIIKYNSMTWTWADILLLPVAFDVSGTSSAHQPASMVLIHHEAIRALFWKPWPGPAHGNLKLAVLWQSRSSELELGQTDGLNLKSGSDWKC